MAEQHDYHCDRCNRDFNSQEQLEQHNREQHQQQAESRESNPGPGRQSGSDTQRRGDM